MDYDSGVTDNVGTLRSSACRDQNVSWTYVCISDYTESRRGLGKLKDVGLILLT